MSGFGVVHGLCAEFIVGALWFPPSPVPGVLGFVLCIFGTALRGAVLPDRVGSPMVTLDAVSPGVGVGAFAFSGACVPSLLSVSGWVGDYFHRESLASGNRLQVV